MWSMTLEFDDLYVESSAYHEAAHVVIAAVQNIPLRQRGIRIDQAGNGLSCYHFTVPDGSSNVGPNEAREKTIRATNAGLVAQTKVYPDCRPAGAWCDADTVRKLLDEMYSGSDWFDAREKLRTETVELVEKHWDAINELGKTLWSKGWAGQAAAERRWSLQLMEKSMEGSEIAKVLEGFKIAVNIECALDRIVCFKRVMNSEFPGLRGMSWKR